MKRFFFLLLLKRGWALMLLICFCTVSRLAAENLIQLTHYETGKRLRPISEGTRISYLLKPAQGEPTPKVISGIITEITYTTFTVNGVVVNIADLDRIGEKKAGAVPGSLLASAVGIYFLRIAYSSTFGQDHKSCQACPAVSNGNKRSIAGTVALAGGGLGLNIIALNTLTKNSARDLKKWHLEVISR